MKIFGNTGIQYIIESTAISINFTILIHFSLL